MINELGGDTPIATVTPERAGSIYRAFRALPPDHRNLPDLSGLGLTDAARRANELGLRPMSPKTVNNRMTTYRGLFKEAQDQSVVTENPFKGKNISTALALSYPFKCSKDPGGSLTRISPRHSLPQDNVLPLHKHADLSRLAIVKAETAKLDTTINDAIINESRPWEYLKAKQRSL